MAQYTEEELNLLVAEGQIHVDEIKAIKAEYLADIEQFKQDYIAAFSGKSLGMRNYIINGNFDIWQRATSLTESHTSLQVAYDTVDRFRLFDNTTAGATQGQWKQEWVVEDNLNWVKLTNIQGLNGNSYIYRPVVYLVEGSVGNNLNNKTVTLSFTMKASHNGVYNVAFGKGNDLEFYNTEFEYSGSGKAQKITLTVSVASNAYNESLKCALEIYFFHQVDGSHAAQSDSNLNRWGGQYVVTSKALKWQQITGAWMQIAQVQLEEGATATAFEQRPIGLELGLCRRYYQTCYVDRFSGVVYSSNGDTRMNPITLEHDMRIVPTILNAVFQGHSINVGSATQVNTPWLTWTASMRGQKSFSFSANNPPTGLEKSGAVVSVGSWCGVTFKFDAEM